VLQIRAKRASGRWLFETALTVLERARTAGAVVIVNDRPDITRLAAADGVHVGQDDLAPALVRSVAGGAAIVGLSTHTVGQIRAAVSEPVNYVAMGPVFGTATKETGYDAVGLERVREASARTREGRLPLVAIGGITLERAPAVIEAGADAVAVISDLLATGDPRARVRAFLAALA
jgi:thiamine-phosphate pyrophosphorylase